MPVVFSVVWLLTTPALAQDADPNAAEPAPPAEAAETVEAAPEDEVATAPETPASPEDAASEDAAMETADAADVAPASEPSAEMAETDDAETEKVSEAEVMEAALDATSEAAAQLEALDEMPVPEPVTDMGVEDLEVPPAPVVVPPPAVKSRQVGDYPLSMAAVHGGASITCEASLAVDKRGKVSRVALTSCPDGFQLAALEALYGWTYQKPAGGQAVVDVSVGFQRKKDRSFFPGYAVLVDGQQWVDALEREAVTLKGGAMPNYPRRVGSGDQTCQVSLRVDRKGKSTDLLVDGCALPFKKEAIKAIKKWTWHPAVDEAGEAVDQDIKVDIAFEM